MKRIGRNNPVRLEVRITENQKQRLVELSTATDVSISSLVRFAINNLISTYDDSEELGQVQEEDE